jgi:hypothetical protein
MFLVPLFKGRRNFPKIKNLWSMVATKIVKKKFIVNNDEVIFEFF